MDNFFILDYETLSLLFSTFDFLDILNFSGVSVSTRNFVVQYVFPLINSTFWEDVKENENFDDMFADDSFYAEDEKLTEMTPYGNFAISTLTKHRKRILGLLR